MVGFTDVRKILDAAIGTWSAQKNRQANLSGHGAAFQWGTKAQLLAAVGHGRQLVQPEVRGNGKGDQANLVIDLRTGLAGPKSRMPEGGPYVADSDIQIIEDWINAGCPD